jgi:hypothetical protein
VTAVDVLGAFADAARSGRTKPAAGLTIIVIDHWVWHRSQGGCGQCGTPVEAGSLCPRCARLVAEKVGRCRQKRADSGACIECGRCQPAPGRSRCRQCLDRQARLKAKRIALSRSCNGT